MSILVTGAAGFIGYHVCEALLARGEQVVGLDDLNDYYDPALKQARLDRLQGRNRFAFQRLNIADREGIDALFGAHADIDRVVHLAAQAGVRYSLINPYAYVQTNVVGQITILEACRALAVDGRLKHLVYASSSSVYGGNTKIPFATDDRVDSPVSLYAATKRADELMGHCYAHLYGIPSTGLRFFTVYGPWGRPDMAAYIFTRRILAGEPIEMFNHGNMRRDFTYIDDIVAGTVAALDHPPAAEDGDASGPPHRLYNLGNHRPEKLTDFIATLEDAIGRKAIIEPKPIQPGDVPETYADISDAARDLGFSPTTPISEGIPKFVDWYRAYHGV
ncbi:MAG: NAD-dependent epimerase [Alphaproteobacteria bacterium]|nr:NAD-dependent epimerase [Alphaproteobacteria bacterium]